jgi:hypothetical protein
MTDKDDTRFTVGQMIRFVGSYVIHEGDKKRMVMDTIPRVGVIVKVIDLNAMGLEHQVLEIYSENIVCNVRTGMPDTVIALLQDTK